MGDLQPLVSAPDYIGPLEGWRVWRVVERGGELALASVVRRTVWPARRPLVAECLDCRTLRAWLRRQPSHPAPALDCECGIYATDLDRAAPYLADTLPEARARVLGRVALWGTVVRCENGFRASHAYPRVLYVAADASPGWQLAPADLEWGLARYGVPLEIVGATTGRDARRRAGRG